MELVDVFILSLEMLLKKLIFDERLETGFVAGLFLTHPKTVSSFFLSVELFGDIRNLKVSDDDSG